MPVDVKKGAILARYRLDRLIGGGGSSAVWMAYDTETDERVALKLFHPELLAEPRALMRAKREAELLGRLRHPNLARCLGAYFEDDPPFLVIDYIEGRTLAGVLVGLTAQGRGLALPVALSILEQIAAAVDFAHEAGVVHRDLKPANVMLSGNLGTPKVTVLDLGVAKLLAPDGDDPTTLGRLLGTYAYMSPEQARGDSIDGRSDVFTLGVLFFEMLTRRRPWLLDGAGELQAFGDSIVASTNPPLEVMRRIAGAPRPRLQDHRPELPAGLDDALARALSVDPDGRPSTASALVEALRAASAQATPEQDPTMIAAAPRTGTPLYATVQVATPTVQVNSPTPTGTVPVIKVSPAGPRRLGVVALLGFGAFTAILGWWAGLRMGEARQVTIPVTPPARTEGPVVATPEPTTPKVEPKVAPVPDEVTPPPPPAAPTAPPKSPRPPTPTRPRVEGPSQLERVLKAQRAAEAEPNAPERLGELARAIEAAAVELPSESERAQVLRIARSSALVGDLDGLRRAVEVLRRAEAP